MAVKPLTKASRAALLKRWRAAEAAGDGRTLRELRDEYSAALPRLALSRDPRTGEVAERAFDAFDLDGPFWDYADPARPSIEPRPASVLAFTGALHLNGAPPATTFLAKPGPGAPFVVPRLLELPGVTAVISRVGVGPHDGYPVFYFADPLPSGLVRFNDWGADRSWRPTADGGWGWERNAEDFEVLDFDLLPWVRAGKLAWIAPGDTSLRVQSSVDGFPYAGVDGPHGFQRVHLAQVSAPELSDAQKAIGPVSLLP
ncbi:MAG TPA: hypothetical protein VG245_09970 [Candidatus Dormibacteraeota bacterium]|jgi:hypothetical protein|nr:hypothetical protein [Candidatus Dormibacteraeota bacterium]